jgi:hypothetical protein
MATTYCSKALHVALGLKKIVGANLVCLNFEVLLVSNGILI